MSAIQSNGSTSRSSNSSGSIQSLNLGSYCVDQVAELINWSNARSFSLPKRSPWVQIDSADQPTSSKKPEQPNQSEDIASGFVDATESDAAARVDESVDDVDPSLNQSIHSHDEVVTEATLPDSVSESASQSNAEMEPEMESVAEIDEIPHATPVAETVVSNATASETPPPINMTPQPMMKTPMKGKPMEIRQPMMMETTSVSHSESSHVDSSEYLRRLECLVLDLNMQLARATGDVSNQDASVTTWLRKRVIELSLENMSLHEKLNRGT